MDVKEDFTIFILALVKVLVYFKIALSYNEIVKLFYYLQKECNLPLDLGWVTKDCCIDLDYYLARSINLKFLRSFKSWNGETFINVYEVGPKANKLNSITDDIVLNYKTIESLLGFKTL